MRAAILRAVPGARLQPPATVEEIAAAEKLLGVTLPEPLRLFYEACNGFSEPVGGASYLLPLQSAPSDASLVEQTLFWWHQYPEYFPSLDFRPFVIFGSSSADYTWGMRLTAPVEIIEYHHHMEDKYRVIGTDVLDVFRRDFASYDDV